MRLLTSFSARAQRARELAAFFYAQRVKGFAPPGEPELDAEALQRLTSELKQCRNYLEFGSGGSTLLANRLGVRTTSVESDPYYANVVREAISNASLVTILTPDMGITLEWGWPAFGTKRKGRPYVGAPFPMRPFPDLILVDGRYRIACALESARQANGAGKNCTLIVDDYLERPHYHVVEQYLGKPERVGRAAIFAIGEQRVEESAIMQYLTNAQ